MEKSSNPHRYLPVTVQLQVPAVVDNQQVTELLMRPPTTRDVLLAQKSTSAPEDRDICLYANLCGVTEDCVRDLPFYDYLQLEAAYALFLLPIQQHCANRVSWSSAPAEEAASATSVTGLSPSSTTGSVPPTS